MIAFLTIVGLIASFIISYIVLRQLQNKTLIRGWSWKAEPSGSNYLVTIYDPEGIQWGYTGYDTKTPYAFDEGRYHTSGARRQWVVSSPRFIKMKVAKCARKRQQQQRLRARQTVEGTF